MRSPTLAGWAFILGDLLGLRFARSFEKHCAEQTTSIGSDQSFGLGFGIDGMKSPLRELGSAGKYDSSEEFMGEFRLRKFSK
jgi:hypothetical protein